MILTDSDRDNKGRHLCKRSVFILQTEVQISSLVHAGHHLLQLSLSAHLKNTDSITGQTCSGRWGDIGYFCRIKTKTSVRCSLVAA